MARRATAGGLVAYTSPRSPPATSPTALETPDGRPWVREGVREHSDWSA
jgi:hypothetical protein